LPGNAARRLHDDLLEVYAVSVVKNIGDSLVVPLSSAHRLRE
jgi:hypothetical protein